MPEPVSNRKLIQMAYARILMAVVGLGIMFFWPAGTLAYWQAWVYMAVLFIPMFFLIHYLAKNDPGLLERRMKAREKESKQKGFVILASILILIAFILPGLDVRFGWSNVPALVSLAAAAIVGISYYLFILVLKANSFAARTVETEEQQTVATSGPYAVVRHPMYLAISLLYVFSPLALGSWWAMIPTVFLPLVLVGRIKNEEEVLMRELKGYSEYVQKTRYRLFPGIW